MTPSQKLTLSPRRGGPLRLALVVVLGLLLQHVVLSGARVYGAEPDVMVLLVVAAGLAGGPERGAIVGFVVGIATDLFLVTPFGLSALAGTVTGFATGAIAASIPEGALWVAPVASGAASAFAVALYGGLDAIIGGNEVQPVHLVAAVLVVGVCNVALGPLAVRVMTWVLGAGAETSRRYSRSARRQGRRRRGSPGRSLGAGARVGA